MREDWMRYQNEAHGKAEQDPSFIVHRSPSSEIRNLGRLKIMSDSCRAESQSHPAGAPAILSVATLYIDWKLYNHSLRRFRVYGFIVAKPEAGRGPSLISEHAVIREV
jgi:hypothetical protein